MSDETTVAVVEKPKKGSALVKTGQLGVSDVNLTPDQVITAALSSGYYKHIKSKAEAYIIAAYGAAMKMDLTTALSSIILINGKMTLSANYVAAMVKKSGKYRYKVKSKTDKACSIEFYEKVEHCDRDGKQWWEWELSGTETFSVEMAKRAQLTGKGPNWNSYPEAMCFARAMTAGSRTYCPDLFLGQSIYTPDELDPTLKMTVNSEGDVVPDAEYTVATNSANHSEQKAVASRLPEINDLMGKTKTDASQFLNYFGVDAVEKLSPDAQAKAVQLLSEKLKVLPKA